MGPPGGPGTYVNSLALLRLLDPTAWPEGYQVFVAGYAEVADGGGGLFTYVVAATDADNDGTIIAPAGGVGRWFRSYTGPVSVKWFGATGDGVTDDTASIQAAVSLAETGDGTTTISGASVFIPAGIYLFTSITLARGVTLAGAGTTLTILKHTATTGLGLVFDSTGLTVNDAPDVVTIQDMEVIQVGTATAGGLISVTGVTSAARLIMEDVRVVGGYRGVMTYNTAGSYLRNVESISAVSDGFYFIGEFRAQTTINCVAEECGVNGFTMVGGLSSTFIGCRSNRNTANGFEGTSINYTGFYACQNEGNVIGIKLTGSTGNVIDDFFTYVQVNTDSAVMLDMSNNNDLRNLSSNHQNPAYGTFMVDATGSTGNRLTLGFVSSAWPSGYVSAEDNFDQLTITGTTTFTTEMVFKNARINAVNLPTTLPATTGDIWNNSGILEVTP